VSHTPQALRGMVVAPHHLAAESGLAVLRQGGNAIEAVVAAAATIAVVYPHMNGIGGDGFWLIHAPDAAPIGIDACGAAGRAADEALYRGHGLAAIPARGPLAANTVAGAVSGWQAALEISAEWGGRQALPRLLEDAIHYAEAGIVVSDGQHALTTAKLAELIDQPGFAETFLVGGAAPAAGAILRQPRLGATLRRLADHGLEEFYWGDLARRIAADLERIGAPLSEDDLAGHLPSRVTPLALDHSLGRIYNLPPPTQGLASLIILGLFDRLGVTAADGFAHVHGLVEATKQAFLVRDAVITDPAHMTEDAMSYLAPAALDARAAAIDRRRAMPWPAPAPGAGDTVWLGAIDRRGRGASYIQSIYWEFGAGVVLGETGLLWQNRGASFALEKSAQNHLTPGRKPFHTLNPALTQLKDGRVMVYGTMGGDGQPQTQAALFTRYAGFGQGLQAAISAPRWLLGRTWGAGTTTLKLEEDFDAQAVAALAAAGHEIELVAPCNDLMGHAGAVVHHPGGLIEGAADPRSDGRAAGF
jgi:oxamate amidohydrolase